MPVSSPALTDALADIIGREHLIGDALALDAHAVDGALPRWVARPAGMEETGRVMALARAEGLAVVPRGSGAALALGNPPRRVDLVLDLGRLDAVLEYEPDDMVATVQAGAPLAVLARRVAERGQMLALDPVGGASRSIGGVLATNASGPLRFRYGSARDLTLGVRFVQADGTITWGGAKVVKSVTGYDVPKLMVGSLGTLGVIVEATLRLHPLPPARGTWLFASSKPDAVEDFLAALLGSSLEPDRITLLNAEASRVVGNIGEELVVLVSFGSVEEAVASQGAALAPLARAHDGRVEPAPPAGWTRLGEALTAAIALRLTGEPRRLVFWLGELERLASRLGLGASAVCQAGNGVIDLALRGAVSGTALDGIMLRPLRAALASEGGSLIVERAPAEIKPDLDAWGPITPDVLAIMSRVKHEFDPDGILNPGRFVGGL
jgi:glycolate oxidase FAD binding subunit